MAPRRADPPGCSRSTARAEQDGGDQRAKMRPAPCIENTSRPSPRTACPILAHDRRGTGSHRDADARMIGRQQEDEALANARPGPDARIRTYSRRCACARGCRRCAEDQGADRGGKERGELSQETSPVAGALGLEQGDDDPITNRSYAVGEEARPEMNMIFNWNRVILESSSVANASGLTLGP